MQRVGSEYVLRAPIGGGSTGQVWRAATVEGDRPVAIKLLDPRLARDPATVARFVQERSILTGLRSSHLVRVHDLVAERETLAIVMDLVDGVDLRQHLLRVGTLAPGLATELVGQVLGALSVVHRAGIVHRDVKPENILLDLADAERPLALLTDFGIARIVTDPGQRPSSLAGTLSYMAPEAARSGDAGPSSDLYATGVVLYELLAGRVPFEASDPFTLLRLQETQPPPPVPGLPSELQSVLAALLAREPGDRPANAAQARQALAAAAVEVRGLTALPSLGETDRYDGPTIPPGVAPALNQAPFAITPPTPAPAPATPPGGSRRLFEPVGAPARPAVAPAVAMATATAVQTPPAGGIIDAGGLVVPAGADPGTAPIPLPTAPPPSAAVSPTDATPPAGLRAPAPVAQGLRSPLPGPRESAPRPPARWEPGPGTRALGAGSAPTALGTQPEYPTGADYSTGAGYAGPGSTGEAHPVPGHADDDDERRRRRKVFLTTVLISVAVLLAALAAFLLLRPDPTGRTDGSTPGPTGSAPVVLPAAPSPSAAATPVSSPTPSEASPSPSPSEKAKAEPKKPAGPARVPSVVGLERARALARLRAVGLTGTSVTYGCYAGRAADHVQSQTPAAGSKVTSSTRATLTVEATNCAKVPNVVGRSLSDAVARLRAAGWQSILRVGGGRGDGSSTVVGQSLQAGSTFRTSDPIVLVVANSGGGGGGGGGGG